MIMVSGVTGAMGQELVKLLQTAGADFQVSSPSLPPLPIEISKLQMDYDNPRLLEQSLREVKTLVLLQSWSEALEPEMERILRAARSSGVSYIVRISVGGASIVSPYAFQKTQGRADAILEESGMAFCILRPNILMQTFVDPLGEDIRRGALFLPEGEGRTSYFDSRDLALAALRVILNPWHYRNQYLNLTGERALSKAEAMSLISYQVRRRLAYVPITEEAALINLQKKGATPWEIELGMSQHRAAREGALEYLSGDFQEILQRSPRAFEEFCREMKDEWLLPAWNNLDRGPSSSYSL